MYPKININLQKITHNAKTILNQCRKHNIDVFAVTKVTSADLKVAQAILDGGITKFADSRIQNIKKLKTNFPNIPVMLLRLPMFSEIEEIVQYCDYILASEEKTILELEKYAAIYGKSPKLILMVDLGDLREGFWADTLDDFCEITKKITNCRIDGMGVNLACYGGVIPTALKMNDLIFLAKEFQEKTGITLKTISGGNSSTLPLVISDEIPFDINNLRIGEAIMLGRNVINRHPWPDTFQDTFTFEAQIIELKEKPSVPQGLIGQDAFGNTPDYEDRGVHHRAILGAGRQDIAVDGLIPLGNYEVLGASSDHIIIDVEKIHSDIKLGDTLEFMLSYGALLQAFTSEYVYKNYMEE
ncbi:MAG: alanine/ornithine racemase family PLP-dependent enzyme [Candidatus Muirbacterium halophilum]|nr:alanine/ornithine racemase family PLP-dependent enzyme [Candidatus Muirbacterium halophilum]